MINEEPDCYHEGEEGTGPFRSYPSGHSAIGWAWALILAEIDPERADAILARGRSFGESRMVCNVHWHSDAIAGRAIAEAAVARLHTNETFLADLAAAKNEFRAVRGSGPSAEVDCSAEAEALGV